MTTRPLKDYRIIVVLTELLYCCTLPDYRSLRGLCFRTNGHFKWDSKICISKPAHSFVFAVSSVVRTRMPLRTRAAYPQRAYELGRALSLKTGRPLEYCCAPLWRGVSCEK